TVLPAGAAKADGQVALALVDVVWQQIDEQLGNAGDEFPSLRERADVLGHPRVPSGVGTELGHKVRIGQKAHVKEQVGFLRNALLVAEAYAGNQDVFVRGLPLEALGEVRAEFVYVELGSIDHHVGQVAQRGKPAALGGER